MVRIINANSMEINASNRINTAIINQEGNKIFPNKETIKLEKNIITINRNFAFLIGIFLMLAASAFAQQTLPTLISLQGKLTNTTTGSTIVNADLRVNISDYSGNTIWNETFAGGVSNGFFDLLLGSDADNPLNLTFNNDYNISIYVGSASGAQIGGTYRFRSGIGGINPSNITSGNFSAPGNFSFGSSLFIDKTNNRVGIGTTNPAFDLHIIGNINATGSINATVIEAGSIFQNGKKVNDSVIIGTHPVGGEVSGTIDSITLSDTALDDQYLKIEDNVSLSLWNASGINIYLRAITGSVGIGTTSPAFKLHVIGNINATGSINATRIEANEILVNGAVVNRSIDLSSYNQSLNIGAQAVGGEVSGTIGSITLSDTALDDQYLKIEDNVSLSLWNASGINIYLRAITGNVGIGTTAPTKKLSVNGTLNALTVDPSAKDPTINTTGQNITISSSSGSVIIQLG